ncbi:MAG: 2-C-methyl-D-erythritol 4-phosphate cytidylyltransferase, partial [Candidatus Methylomirabilia bacterium]
SRPNAVGPLGALRRPALRGPLRLVGMSLGRAPPAHARWDGMRAVGIVPAAGSGSRMGGSHPKQFLRVGRVPVVVLTLRMLSRASELEGVIVAAPPGRVATTDRLVKRWGVARILGVVPGGRTRQESVWVALQHVPAGTGLVVVHDAVRPFITAALVRDVIREARRHGAAVCGVPVWETVKRVQGRVVVATVEREGLWLVQTPQAFHRALLSEAHEKARRDGVVGTDDAALVERLGVPVHVVVGLPQNLKITTREDLVRARAVAARRRV